MNSLPTSSRELSIWLAEMRDRLTLKAYDHAARWCAAGDHPADGSVLPQGICDSAVQMIREDKAAFAAHVDTFRRR